MASLFEYIDSIMMYDGEEPLARLLEALDSGDDNLDCVPNLCHAKGGKICKTIGLSKHLSTIQFPISMASPFLNTSCLS